MLEGKTPPCWSSNIPLKLQLQDVWPGTCDQEPSECVCVGSEVAMACYGRSSPLPSSEHPLVAGDAVGVATAKNGLNIQMSIMP